MAAAKMRISYPHVTKTPGGCGGKACINREEIDAELAADKSWAESLDR